MSDEPNKVTQYLNLITSIFSSGVFSKILGLGILILTEIFEAKKDARVKQEQFELTQEKFNSMVENALVKLRGDAVKESTQANDVDSQVDADQKKGSLS